MKTLRCSNSGRVIYCTSLVRFQIEFVVCLLLLCWETEFRRVRACCVKHWAK
jgi:hypothetical protein